MDKSDVNDFIRQNASSHSDKEIAELLAAQGIQLSATAVKNRRQRMNIEKPQQGIRKDQPGGNLGKLQQLLEKSGIPVDEIDSVQSVRINSYQGLTKDADGEVQIHDMEAASLVLKPKWSEGPAWPVVQPATPHPIRPVLTKRPKGTWQTAVILPDPQIGYRRIGEGLDPFHDERAMNIALQVVRELQPDIIINIGDMLDFAEFSRFTQEPTFALTTQATIDRAYRFLAEQRANAPHAKIILMEGNHDRRIGMRIIENAKAAFGLRRADQPEGWPVLSVENLLALDTLEVTYISGYPAASYYINDRVKVMHGAKAGKRGTVANRIVDDERVSTIVGHTHHINQTYKTVDTLKGPRTSFAATLGCLCRIDGAVPSTKGSTDTFGRPVKRYEDWQQAVGVVTYMEGDNPFALEHAYIHEGLALLRGKAYIAEGI